MTQLRWGQLRLENKFHHELLKRKELTAAEKRKRKLKWLRKLYKDAKNAELIQDNDILKNDPNIEKMYSNPFDEQRFIEYDDSEFDKEVNSLIEWWEDLDYDKYVANWGELATSGQSDIKKEEIGDLDEELFLKDNEDYEHKLKQHLYLFDEKEDSKVK